MPFGQEKGAIPGVSAKPFLAVGGGTGNGVWAVSCVSIGGWIPIWRVGFPVLMVPVDGLWSW